MMNSIEVDNIANFKYYEFSHGRLRVGNTFAVQSIVVSYGPNTRKIVQNQTSNFK